MPRNAVEAKGLLLASIREPDPVIFFEPKILYRTSVEDVPDGDYEVPLGVADIMRDGTDVTLVRKGYIGRSDHLGFNSLRRNARLAFVREHAPSR